MSKSTTRQTRVESRCLPLVRRDDQNHNRVKQRGQTHHTKGPLRHLSSPPPAPPPPPLPPPSSPPGTRPVSSGSSEGEEVMLCASPWLTLSYSSLVVVPAVSLKRRQGRRAGGRAGLGGRQVLNSFAMTLYATGCCVANNPLRVYVYVQANLKPAGEVMQRKILSSRARVREEF